MNKRISQLVAVGFAILICLGLATNLFLTLTVQQSLVEAQHIEDTSVEARAATRSLRADFLEMSGALGAALLNPALKSRFYTFREQKIKSNDSANAHLQKAAARTQSKELKALLGQLKARCDNITDPLEREVVRLAKMDMPKARQLYVMRYLPAEHENIGISEAALKLATQNVIDLKESIATQDAFAQLVVRRAILVFVLIGVGSGFFLTRAVSAIVRKAEQAARANQNMLEYSQDVICSIDGEGRFIDVSPACGRVWGYSPVELEGRLFRELIHPDDLAKTDEVAKDIISGIALKDFENRYLCQDGSVVDMLWSAHWSGEEKSMFCVGRDITERKVAQEKLRTLAMFDGLTGLMNRTAITGFLTREIERASREGQSLSVLLLDLDHFKKVNDTYGHAAGDAVLTEAARRLKSSMRGYDEVGRYGGEEFLIVAPGCASENVLALAERVRCAIASTPVDIGEKMLQISCSLGAAVKSQGEKEEIGSFIQRADAALYRAKEGGRNRAELALITLAPVTLVPVASEPITLAPVTLGSQSSGIQKV